MPPVAPTDRYGDMGQRCRASRLAGRDVSSRARRLTGPRARATVHTRGDQREEQAHRERLDERLAEHRRMRAMTEDEQQEWQRELRRTLRDDPPLQVMYTALQVLDPQDGQTLENMELPGWVRSGFCPARDKIIFEPAGYAISWYMNYWEGGDRMLSAYDWLEPGGDN